MNNIFKKNSTAISICAFIIGVVMNVFVSYRFSIVPSGFFAFAKSDDVYTRLFWWVWPVLWIMGAHIYIIKRNDFRLYVNPLVRFVGVFGTLMIIRTALMVPLSLIFTDWLHLLPSVDQKLDIHNIQMPIGWRYLWGSVISGIPIAYQILVWVIGAVITALYVWCLRPRNGEPITHNIVLMLVSILCIQGKAALCYTLLIGFPMFMLSLFIGLYSEVIFEKRSTQRLDGPVNI
ncbi:MAG: hypothetical protein ACYC27_20030 [Armatimonadota bacterium]